MIPRGSACARLLTTTCFYFISTRSQDLARAACRRSMSTRKTVDQDVIQKCIVPFSTSTHKGTSGGRVGILGGNEQYTGAPFYASMAALTAGADLVYVFTAQEATLPIKTYSPELMVSSVYAAHEFQQASLQNTHDGGQIISKQQELLIQDMVQKVTDLLPRLHCLVVGPGMGRHPMVQQAVSRIVKAAIQQKLVIVMDADALYMLSLEEYSNMLQDYDRIILTPNVVEYQRLLVNKDRAAREKPKQQLHGDEGQPRTDAILPDSLQYAIIVRKGSIDKIQRGNQLLLECDEEGGLKRSGGIGDILAGTLGAMGASMTLLEEQNQETNLPLSAWLACSFVKRATNDAFLQHKRAMTAPHILQTLGPAMREMLNEQ